MLWNPTRETVVTGEWDFRGKSWQLTKNSGETAPTSAPSVDWAYTGNDQAFFDPILAQGNVYYGADLASTIYAVDRTGTELWTYSAGASDAHVFHYDETIYVVDYDSGTSTYHLIALDPATGTQQSDLDLEVSFPSDAGFIESGKLYITGQNGCGRWDLSTGKEWTYTQSNTGNQATPINVSANHVYTFNSGDLLALEADTGATDWSVTASQDSFPNWVEPVVSDGAIVVAEDTTISCYEESDGSLRWDYTTNNTLTDATGCADTNHYYFRDGSDLVTLNLSDGTQAYTPLSTSESLDELTVDANENIIASTSTNAKVLAYDPSAGIKLWGVDTETTAGETGRQVTIDENGGLYCNFADSNKLRKLS